MHIANLSLRFIRYMKYRKYDRLVLPDDLSRQDALIRQLELWSQTLDNLLASDQVTRRDLDAAKTLRIHQIVCLLWMRRSTTPEECSNDLSMSEFETAVDLAESIHSVAGTRGQRCELNSSTFLFDMEIVSPIYYVCLKCRHPQLRRRAITVLAGAWRREGLWDSNMAAAIARRCVELEEKNLTILDGSQLPLERDRMSVSSSTPTKRLGGIADGCTATTSTSTRKSASIPNTTASRYTRSPKAWTDPG